MSNVLFTDFDGEMTLRQYYAPKKAGSIRAWYVEARKVIPQIPKLTRQDLTLVKEEADLNTVSFVIRDLTGALAYVTINRSQS